MRVILTFLLILTVGATIAQKPCYQHSRLYLFDQGNEPRLFTDTLGRHPQFPFLQRVNGITTKEFFIKSINDPVQQKKYAREFKAFDLLLHNSGFGRGYLNLNLKNVRKVYVTPGTVGNLGYYDKSTDVMNYIYVKLNPAGESPDGIEAWKITTQSGCYLYILFTCGNAFYPNAAITPTSGTPGAGVIIGASGSTAVCKTVMVQATVIPPVQKSDSISRPATLRMNFYHAILTPSNRRHRLYDTTVSLIRHKDTLVHFRDRLVVPGNLDPKSRSKIFSICRDSTVTMNIPLIGDSTKQTDSIRPIHYVMSDTVYEKKTPEPEAECENNWEVSVEAGKSFNSIPRLDDPTEHTQTNGSQTTATISVSRFMASWFQLGVTASYIVLSYQDDINYPGHVAGTYNTVYLGKPIIPVQLFGKFNFGKPIGFQSSISLSIGYSIPTNGKIEDNGATLNTNPNLKGDFTAALKFGIAYYFSCHVGIGASFTGEYFNNKSDLIAYSLYALPIQGGFHFRF
jgi:hypothetical protein